MISEWTPGQLRQAQQTLRKYPEHRFREALVEIAKRLRRPVTGDSLHAVFRRRGIGSPTSFCMKKKESRVQDGRDHVELDPQVARLVGFAKKGPVRFEVICDRMDMSPSKVRALIDRAERDGIQIHVEHDHIGIRPSYQEERIRSVGIAPVVGEIQKVAVISDTHLGSKYCLREALVDFVHYAYDKGIREILHPGDVLDGMYRHGMWEVSHSGIEDQTKDLFETLPQLPGLSYHMINGNHDETFMSQIGLDVGRYVMGYFRDHGRTDVHYYGDRSAFLRLHGAVFHLWHPRSGVSYAKSYQLQKIVEKYSSSEKPHIMLAGHWHIFAHCFERGVHALACPTFQGGGSAFAKSLGGAPAIGGLLLQWEMTEHLTMRNFTVGYRAYFEAEQVREIEPPPGILIK